MPRSLKEILAQADEFADRFAQHDLVPEGLRDAASLRLVRSAVLSRLEDEAHLAEAVANARGEGHSWAVIGAMLGTSGEAARQRYGKDPTPKGHRGKRSPSMGSTGTVSQFEGAVLQSPPIPSAPSSGGRHNISPMLRRFLYLDEQALSDYLSALEDGSREAAQRRRADTQSGGGGVDAKIIKGELQRSSENEETLSLSDTSTARFERMMKLLVADPEAAGWVEVFDPDVEFSDIGIGALVETECEIFVPDLVKTLSASGGLPRALDQLDALLPFATALGLGTEGLPNKTERDAVRGFVQALDSDQVLVGEFEDRTWRVAGRLAAEGIRGEIDGVARVIGKVSSRWPAGQWKPLLALPGMSFLPRDRRRQLQRSTPEPGQEDQYLEGPALMLDLLAIYR